MPLVTARSITRTKHRHVIDVVVHCCDGNRLARDFFADFGYNQDELVSNESSNHG